MESSYLTDAERAKLEDLLKAPESLWPKTGKGDSLSTGQKSKMAYYAVKFGFNPFAKHLAALPGDQICPTGEGLRWLAHKNKCEGIHVQPVLEDWENIHFVFKATVYPYPKSLGFEDEGDADKTNVSAMVLKTQGAGGVRRVAMTRAINRAIKNAYSLDMPVAETDSEDIESIDLDDDVTEIPDDLELPADTPIAAAPSPSRSSAPLKPKEDAVVPPKEKENPKTKPEVQNWDDPKRIDSLRQELGFLLKGLGYSQPQMKEWVDTNRAVWAKGELLRLIAKAQGKVTPDPGLVNNETRTVDQLRVELFSILTKGGRSKEQVGEWVAEQHKEWSVTELLRLIELAEAQVEGRQNETA